MSEEMSFEEVKREYEEGDNNLRKEIFENVKETYRWLRLQQRDAIVEYFRGKTFQVEHHKAHVEIAKSFCGRGKNNRNWLGLDLVIKYDDSDYYDGFYISLQSFDTDSQTGNVHVVMDRIGIYQYHGHDSEILKPENRNTINGFDEMETTDIYLPMDSTDFEKLEQLIMPQTRIIKSDILSQSCGNQYYLELNRSAGRLEVYERADIEEVRELLPLREDFDASGYALYRMRNAFPCVIGGEGKTKTPEGIFRVEKASELHEEYVSPYHPVYDEVKIFGYLVIFEDYFIYSNDIYLMDATVDDFSQKMPISGQDEHSSGCVHVPQENLDWLVQNIPAGTTIKL